MATCEDITTEAECITGVTQTFGYTGGIDAWYDLINYIRSTAFSPSEEGDAIKLRFWADVSGNPGYLKAAIYDQNRNFLGETNELYVDFWVSDVYGPLEFDLINPVHVLPTENYYLAIWADTSGMTLPASYTGGNGLYYHSLVYGTWPAVLSETNHPNYRLKGDCVYVTEPCYWYNGSCHATPPPICDYFTEADCTAGGCYWYNGSCHQFPPATCEELISETDCLAYNCHWYNGSCHTIPPATCEELNNEPDCLSYGCYWYDGGCHTSPICGNIITEAECTAAGCFWYDGACHAESQLFEWIGPAHIGIQAVFTTIDAYIMGMEPYGTADQVKIYYKYIRGQ